jgi:nitrogen regulatory protein P-II 1
MKLIKAYIRKRKLEEVYKALKEEGYDSMTMIEGEGTGTFSDHEREHISEKYTFVEAYMVIKLEILVPQDDVKHIIKIIRDNARTGYTGDGMIVVTAAEEVHKIRTDETGIGAI